MKLILFIQLIKNSYTQTGAMIGRRFVLQRNPLLVAARLRVMSQPVIGRVFQVQLTVALGLEIDDQAVVLDLFDDEGQVVQAAQRFAGNRVGSFNAIHMTHTPAWKYIEHCL